MLIIFKLFLFILLVNTSLFCLDQEQISSQTEQHISVVISNEDLYSEEKEFWDMVQTINTIQEYKYYLKNYPNGNYKKIAQYKIKILRAQVIKYALTIYPTPADAKITLINTQQNYNNPLELELGRYKIKVAKKGYEPKFKSVYLDKNITLAIKLRKLKP